MKKIFLFLVLVFISFSCLASEAQGYLNVSIRIVNSCDIHHGNVFEVKNNQDYSLNISCTPNTYFATTLSPFIYQINDTKNDSAISYKTVNIYF
jgi:hypothetical protein